MKLRKAFKNLAISAPFVVLFAVSGGVSLASDVNSTSTQVVLTQNKVVSPKLTAAQRKVNLKAKISTKKITPTSTSVRIQNNKSKKIKTPKKVKQNTSATSTTSTIKI
ncbi:MAG: hypothetical protein WCQ00_00045 [bacterium]